MSNPITTAYFTSGDVVTYHQSGQDVRDWVGDHSDALKNKTVSGDDLVTTWTSLNGLQTVDTHRVTGPPPEPDEIFIARHIAAYLAAMQTEPPKP